MDIKRLSRSWRFQNHIVEICDDQMQADQSKQKFTVVGINTHIGVRLRCNRCGEIFAFTAKEQKHWYEELHFWVDSVPVECIECRGVTRSIVNFNKRLSRLLSVNKLKNEDYNEIVEISLGLVANGVQLGGRLAQKIRMAAKRSNHKSKLSLLNKIKSI